MLNKNKNEYTIGTCNLIITNIFIGGILRFNSYH